MDLSEIIKETYPEINDGEFSRGRIELRDDGDGVQYISKWDYDKPIPKGLKLGK